MGSNGTTTPSLPDTSHLDGVNYLFGHPIAHSLSPLLHQTVYDNLGLKRSQIPLDSTDIPHFLSLTKDPKFFGASVTMPHKVAIIPHLDEIMQEGKDIGACNTIFLKQDQNGTRHLVGTNTDCFGVRDAFLQNLPAGKDKDLYRGHPGLVIGGGGACRSAVYALQKWLGCNPIYIVNRDISEVTAVLTDCKKAGFGDSLLHVQTGAQASLLAAPGAIVACIPNFPPKTPEEIEARKVIEVFLRKEEKGAILEMCYHPTPWTEIAEISKKEGWQVILGTEAMIYQGLEQDRHWTGKGLEELPSKEVHAAIAQALAARH
ncbi:related to ARO1-arom pentafunctional enzyme [Phialocephala subalpina]|uniref:Related to ARO1-arom pentafunctional enzyme n=1 Tax=Phialocephala subalpina TaxID=576137 RepID=A0A1L7WGE0_9HELO|nr:related to ARO1-arom pentafunctional enzyme [Phialocephala subalpina]